MYLIYTDIKNCFRLAIVIIICKITILIIKSRLLKKDDIHRLLHSIIRVRLKLIIATANLQSRFECGEKRSSLALQIKIALMCKRNIDNILIATEDYDKQGDK